MTNADQIAAAIQAEVAIGIEYDADVNAENQLISEIIAKALREARTAGFNEAKERAIRLAEKAIDDAHRFEPGLRRHTQRHTASDIATALQAMKQGGSDDS